MTAELVLLSDIPLTEDLMAQAARTVIPGGAAASYRDGGIVRFADAEGKPVLTVFEPVPVHLPEEAAAQLQDPPTSFALWTELTAPFAAGPASRALAEAFASTVGGVVKEKR